MSGGRVGVAAAPDASIDPATTLSRVRALIAGALLGPPPGSGTMGAITLRPHQQVAAQRLNELLRRHGGAVLADATGLGKTYVALAVARRYQRVLVAAPAALRSMWQAASDRAHTTATFVSLEWLSRQGPDVPHDACDLVIIDEAHHLRNTAARRYAATAELTRGADVLLLSATPVQNRREDLLALLALFLGEHAFALSDTEAADYLVRRAHAPADVRIPRLDGPHWIELGIHDDDCLDGLLALPPPVPAADEGQAGVLAVYSLARQWASSRAALLAALRRRLARAAALEATLVSGHLPTRHELSAWTYADGAMQLAFAELLGAPAAARVEIPELLASVRAHAAGIVALLARVERDLDADAARADALRALRARHSGERIIAFSEFAETVHALAGRLANDTGIAQLTARGARVAGGRITREDVLAQLGGNTGRMVPLAEHITMLLTTDVLSEGLDLHQASVLVHLDLPWNPARLEQRVGRLRRIGSRHPVVSVYVLAPPAAPERLLRVEQRLRMKLGVAGALVGITGRVLPHEQLRSEPSAADDVNAISGTLASWTAEFGIEVPETPPRHPHPMRHARHELPVAAVHAGQRGWLALVEDGDGAPLLVTSLGGGPAVDGQQLARAVDLASGAAAVPDDDQAAAALDELHEWMSLRLGRTTLGLQTTSQVKHRIALRIAACVQGASRQRRAIVVTLAARARELLAYPLGAGAERALAALACRMADGEQWLESVARFAAQQRRYYHRTAQSAFRSPRQATGRVLALILLQPVIDSRSSSSQDNGGEKRGQEGACAADGVSASARR